MRGEGWREGGFYTPPEDVSVSDLDPKKLIMKKLSEEKSWNRESEGQIKIMGKKRKRKKIEFQNAMSNCLG